MESCSCDSCGSEADSVGENDSDSFFEQAEGSAANESSYTKDIDTTESEENSSDDWLDWVKHFTI